MRAIEVTGKVEDQGRLQLDQLLSTATDQRVRVTVLLAESPDGDIDEQEWRETAAKNPSFAFLQGAEEDIHTLNDGQLVNYEGAGRYRYADSFMSDRIQLSLPNFPRTNSDISNP